MRAPDSLTFLLRQAVCLALLTPLIALAEGRTSAADAANPDAAGAPLVHHGMKPLQQRDDTPAPNAWREAHGVVAAFPRGHADILAWEKQTATNTAPAPYRAMQMHMQGSKP